MKLKLLFAAWLATLTLMVTAQPIGWEWGAGTNGEKGIEGGRKIAADAQGNYYGTGISYSDVVKFDNISSNQNGISYLVKYDVDGKAIWAIRPGINVISLSDVVANSTNDIYVIGTFKKYIKLGPDSLSTDTDSYFLAKYHQDGICLWAKKIENTRAGFIVRLAIDKAGYIYVSGKTEQVPKQLFIQKRNSAGDVIWTQNASYSSNAEIKHIAAGNNALYVWGNLGKGSVYFDTDTIHNDSTRLDAFFVKYDANGYLKWTKKIGGAGNDIASETTVDAAGDVYITGNFESTKLLIDTVTLEQISSPTTFLVKLNSSGDALWGKTITGYWYGSYVITDNQNNVFAGGNIDVLRFDAAGNYLGKPSSDAFQANISGMAADGKGNVVITGGFAGGLDLGDVHLYAPGPDRYNNAGFIAKLGNCYSASPTSSLCYVSVDTVSKYNVVKWNKATLLPSVTSIEVFRQTDFTVFKFVGSAPVTDGFFEDKDTTLYPPRNGDPNEGIYSYKIRTVNNCGKYSTLSENNVYNIHLTRDGNDFIMNSYYLGTFIYELMRDDYSDGHWHMVANTPVKSSIHIYRDVDYYKYEKTGRWRIQSKQYVGCDAYEMIYTNILPLRKIITSMEDVKTSDEITLLPNPASNEFVIDRKNLEVTCVEIFNILGERISKTEHFSSDRIVTDISNLSNGLYTVSINTLKGRITKRLVVQKG